MTLKSKPGQSECLRFPQVLLQFDPSKPDPVVTEHLRNCPRCWRLFDSVVRTDATDDEMADFPEMPSTPRSEELENLFYEYLFSPPRKRGTLQRIQERLKQANVEERNYLRQYLFFISSANASTLGQADELRDLIDSNIIYVSFPSAADTDGSGRESSPAPFQNIRYQLAAGDDDNDTALWSETLSNGWVCDILYAGGGRETELQLNYSGAAPARPPILKYYPLPGLTDGEEDGCFSLPVQELRSNASVNGRPVYYVNGDQCAVVFIPDVPEMLKVFTLDYVKSNRG